MSWLVVGIAGATCSGKSTLAKRLGEGLKNSLIINQDEYFLPVDDPRHTPVPELNHHNWELLSSLDTSRMVEDIKKILQDNGSPSGEPRILILDGFLLFNCREIVEICDLRYFLDMNEVECRERRKLRIYDPPDVPNYFEKVVWPEYVKSRSEILDDVKLRDGIEFIDVSGGSEQVFSRVLNDIKGRSSHFGE